MQATSTHPNPPPSSAQKSRRCCNNHPVPKDSPPSSGPHPTSPTGSTPTSTWSTPPRPPTTSCPHLAGLSFHTPRAVDQHRAPETEITARMNQIHHELATSWNDPDVMIMTADEIRIEHEATLRRAWHPTGATTKLRVNRIKQAQSHHRVPPRTRRHRRPDLERRRHQRLGLDHRRGRPGRHRGDRRGRDHHRHRHDHRPDGPRRHG